MNISHLIHRGTGKTSDSAGLSLPGFSIRRAFSLSTKLTLLVVIPLALTLAVTLPLTVTGLNQLASVTSTERLNDEIHLVDKYLKALGDDLERSASNLSENPTLVQAVLKSDSLIVKSVIHESRMKYDLQHLEVLDRNGLDLGHEHETGAGVDKNELDSLKELGMSQLKTTKMVQTSRGWFLVSIRPLLDSNRFIGSISVGKLIDSDALSVMNFERKDPILALLNNNSEVASVSYVSSDPSTHFSIIPDVESAMAARGGEVVIGSGIFDGKY